MIAPPYVAFAVLGGDVAIIAALLAGLHQTLQRTGWPAEERASTLRTMAFVLVAWYAAALTLSWLEFFRGAADRIPTIQFGIFVPIIIGAIVLWRSETLARVIDAVPQSWLVGIQFYRTMGLIFLMLFSAAMLPGSFALPAGVGDVLVGLLAPVVAVLYARRPERREGLVRAWNIFGVLDLIVAVTTGFLTSPSPFSLLSAAAANELVSAFPLVMIPVFAVPVAVLLHVMSLMKLRRTRAAAARTGASPSQNGANHAARPQPS